MLLMSQITFLYIVYQLKYIHNEFLCIHLFIPIKNKEWSYTPKLQSFLFLYLLIYLPLLEIFIFSYGFKELLTSFLSNLKESL